MIDFIKNKSIYLLLLPWIIWGQLNLVDSIPFDNSVRVGKLDNGLTYYIKENSKPENRAELRLAVNIGSVPS